MKKSQIIAETEKFLTSMGVMEGSYLWQPLTAELLIVVGKGFRRVKLKSSITQRALLFEFGVSKPVRARVRARHGVIEGLRVSNIENRLCGALTRRGAACLRKALANGRCPNPGGLSTGPRTSASRQRISEAQKASWAKWRSQTAVQVRLPETAPEPPRPNVVEPVVAVPVSVRSLPQPTARLVRRPLPAMTVNPGRDRYGRGHRGGGRR